MSNLDEGTAVIIGESMEVSLSEEVNKVNSASESPENMKEFMAVEQIIQELQIKQVYPISFNEQELALAKDFFYSHNYFSFSIYRKLLPRVEENQYSFTDCIELYNFNTFIRNNLTNFIRDIELMLRATLIEHVCQLYEMKKRGVRNKPMELRYFPAKLVNYI